MCGRQQHLWTSAVLLQLVLLAVAISVGHHLRRKRVLWIGSAGAALLLGVIVGVLIRLARTAPLVRCWMVFQVRCCTVQSWPCHNAVRAASVSKMLRA